MNLCINDVELYCPNQICAMLISLWASDWQVDDILLGHQIREIIHMRDNFKEEVLNKHECFVLLNHLCTS